MLSAILKFEVLYHFRQITFKIALLLFLGLGLLIIHGNFGGSEIHANAPYVITTIVGFLSLFSIFVCTVFCANVVLRDTTYKMDAVLFTTAIKRLPYFSVRFLGLLLAVLLVLCAAIAGILTGSLLMDATRQGTFDPLYFVQPLLVFGLPNILFVCSIIFCTAMLTRNIRAIYAAGLLLYILYNVGAILGNSPIYASSALRTGGPDLLTLLTDPFGLAIFFTDTHSWSVLQRNEQLLPIRGLLLQNRLLWAAFSFVLLLITYRSFAFRIQLPAKTKSPGTGNKIIAAIPYNSQQVHPAGFIYTLKSFCSQFRLEAISVFKHIPFLVMIALWIFIFTIELKDNLFSGAYGIHFYPATSIIVESLLSIKPAMLLIIFYTAELSARERTTNSQLLLYATPVHNAVIWAAKCCTLGLLIATIISANIIVGVVMQFSNGYLHPDLPRYISLFYYSGFPLFLFAVLALFIQTLVPNKYLGMLLNLLIAAVIIFSRRLGIEHYLLRYASVPDMQNSGMNSFGHYASAFNWYMLYWSAFAALLALLSVSLWQRSQYINNSWRLLRFRLIWLFPILAFLIAGAFIFYKTNIQGGYKSSREKQDWQASYEHRYRTLANLPQPFITSVKTTVDLYSDEAKYIVKGTYKLINTSGVPLSRIWVSVHPEVTYCNIHLPGASREVYDKTFNQHLYDLKTPLLPGAETTLQFSMEVVRSGFTSFNTEHAVADNGTYIELEKYVPSLGYNSSFELSDTSLRKEKGLMAKVPDLPADSAYHLIDIETTISTSPDQYVVTTGTLKRTWSANNRNYFQYKTEVPVNFMFALSSARYDVKKETYRGVEYRILFHPGQTVNLTVMMRAMKDAIDYCTQHFGPYPYKHLTLAEIPQYKGAATAYPGVVFSAENINFQGNFNDSNKINYGYGILVHEIAHQWWANKLAPVYQPGSPLLTETLAQYTEAMLVEQSFGRQFMRRYLQTENQLYFSQRYPDEKELPLAKTYGQAFVHYQKGSLAMYALKEALGTQRINEALRRLLDKHASPGTRATADDLINALSQGASQTEVKLIKDWLERVITYSLKVEVMSSKRLSNGQYDLQLKVQIAKTDDEHNRPIPVDDEIDIAVSDRNTEDGNWLNKPLYLHKHHFTQATTILNITLNKPPKMVAVDPYAYLPDADQSDNLAALK
ncbi:M1 family aminopeptidase [Chitinophaga sp. S165]|uniref:ABC transporter permease/M1 family aminopeptidase n=1 Tax=Chitinophaga sp. S165 TaxID=2135462 RepID=UPI000D84DF05|nr:M1 family aminopeptidase [Chitinophaga sp. S165]PWV56933.1 peptidase M1-like protein [Chitinophaga sp. S165]